MGYLETIDSPDDLKKLKPAALTTYADEVRNRIIATVERRGGHLSSNLGTVELTIALHYVFDCPADKILFDVGHQAYTHKLITGRREAFDRLRESGGIAGFPSRRESAYDAFSVGHSSTALSAGVGFARARDLNRGAHHVVTVVGDGALTGGMSFEALNDIGERQERIIVVLNDNKMSISRNVGALSKYLARLRLSGKYMRLKRDVRRGLDSIPFVGRRLRRLLEKLKNKLKRFLLFNKYFEDLGFKYLGPFDGHDIAALADTFSRVKKEKGPVLVHVLTDKGRGHKRAEEDPARFHGVSAPAASGGERYSAILSERLCAYAGEGRPIAAITAAMCVGTGLEAFEKQYPDRYFDVGIAEEHAVTMAAGLAAAGVKPYFAVYSSFLQRGFDQIVHDVALDALPVVLAVEHAGAVEGDGPTHQGLLDIAFLSLAPGMTVLQPKDGAEFKAMLDFSLGFDAPLAIRYPKKFATVFESKTPFSDALCWETLRAARAGVYLLASGGRMLELGLGIEEAGLVNVRVIHPLDGAALDAVGRDARLVITLEEGVIRGGMGEAVKLYMLGAHPAVRVVNLGFENRFTQGYTVAELFAEAGLTRENIRTIIRSYA
ncbi:MAG: 1-deoxy-D-xylulose-5-phosphate synthase [Clostridiales bacterium]|jgi:1-deoxy-D-xylulose-5-phosphate synthase|nr:1-deoxy-D-xylulose-5-phosphate synthase [Clostridiales bacterium]